MFRIRKRAKCPDLQTVKSDVLDLTVPRFVGRSVLQLLRAIHRGHDELVRIHAVLPADQLTAYESLVRCELQPTFDDVMGLIEQAHANGLINDDEAMNLRAGNFIQIDVPI